MLQREQTQSYEPNGEIEISNILMISNHRFREAYSFIDIGTGDEPEKNERYAGVTDITVRNIRIYADEKVIKEFGKDCLKVKVINKIPTTKYDNISKQ